MKPKILVTRYLFKEEMDFLTKSLPEYDIEINASDSPIERSVLLEKIKNVEGILSTLRHKFDEEILSNAQKLKVISNYAVGYNNIDIEYARKKGIIVTNTPDVLTNATANTTIALMLNITRRFVESDKFLRDGKWKGWKPDFMLGVDLEGKTLGIIGMGRIGIAVAKIARSFGMDIIYFSRTRKKSIESEINARFVEFNELLSSSDIISLHVPLTPETTNLITLNELKIMKKTAYLINTARGSVINEDDLIHALEKNMIAGAGLDVYVKEPIDINNKLINLDNVVLFPHVGSATIETRKKMAEIAINNLILVLKGKEPLYKVV